MQVAEKERMPRLSLGEEKNMVTHLLVINITGFILLFFISIIYQMESFGVPAFERDVLGNVKVPANAMTLLQKPWTLLTAPFAHMQFWDILSNGLWLFCFGSLLQNQTRQRLAVPLYLYGSLAGFAFYIAGMNLIPALRPLAATSSIMGAGAGVMALAVGLTVLDPKARVFPLLMSGGVPVWAITLLYFALHGAAVFTAPGSTPTLLYLGGGTVLGFLFMTQFKKGRNWGKGLNQLMVSSSYIFHPKAAKDKAKADLKVDSSAFRSRTAPAPFTRRGAAVSEQRLDEILDKINEHGIDSLTSEEKETLQRASRDRVED